MKLQQKGFAHLEIIIVLVVVAVIGALGWFVYNGNKLDNSPPAIVPGEVTAKKESKGTTPNEPTNPTATDKIFSIEELGVKLSLKDGWSAVKSTDTYGVSYLISNSASPVSIKAFVSGVPTGFEGCGDTDSYMVPLTVTVLENTGIQDVVVYGDTLTGISVASGKTQYASPIRSLKAPAIYVSDMKVGSSYYVCQSAHPPLSWTVDFDGKTSNQDGIYAYNTADPNTVVTSETAGYNDVLEMLKSISR